ncbi:PIN domain nuclease of toxin-antitoxin system [Natronocella acetinitrilica]|uniref:PIN domain nuclease of toxin-antitoxin system n=1 Tax=Natronocella acetinitrilica TaxID=414046 RepID=A0AAE3G2T1_9GAMM|nr:PIN domain nuclease of toxin-antitoxin system [Natronocella acetinitrilica]
MWKVAIKASLGRGDFHVEPHLLRRGLLENGYEELPISGIHTLGVLSLPDIHRNPFDRMLIAQAQTEGALLLTSDSTVARYPGPVRLV